MFGFNNKKRRIPMLLQIFIIIDILLAFFYIVDVFLGHPFHPLVRLLDLEDETSISTWYSSIQYFCIFILGLIFAINEINSEKKNLLIILLPMLFLFLSLDESATIHEGLGTMSDKLLPDETRQDTSFGRSGVWMFVIGIPFLLLFLLYVKSVRKILAKYKTSLFKLIFGMCIMLIGALGFESLSNFISSDYLYIEIMFEEFLEMLGSTIMLWFFYDIFMELKINLFTNSK